METKIAVFEEKKIRHFEYESETYFTIIDVIEALTDSPRPFEYWTCLKTQERELRRCVGFKMVDESDENLLYDCANTEGVFRLIMSVPSPKAEPFIRWFAKFNSLI